MDKQIQSYFIDLQSEDKNLQYEAFNQIIAATKVEVDWTYDVWDQLKKALTDPNNHQRSRAAQFLCHLAISDPEKRILDDYRAIWQVTYDKKFVTARHTLQTIWRIGLAGEEQKEIIVSSLANRFINGTDEKNYALIRYDILQGLRNLYDEIKDEKIKQIALDLIEKEEDPKYKKKYSTVWKKA
ncbi:hypothetical protein [Sporosarcina sp. NPDC096371]|uniref:hypothetical protein n=1 Tax=Sporosarcina sp. NPDC096371 TaxID=3364530 RepID=UPI0038155567